MQNNNNSKTPSTLDMDVRPPYALQVRSQGYPSDIIGMSLATAIVATGIGVAVAIGSSDAGDADKA